MFLFLGRYEGFGRVLVVVLGWVLALAADWAWVCPFDLDEVTTRAIRVVLCRRIWQALLLDEVCKVLALIQSDAEALN